MGQLDWQPALIMNVVVGIVVNAISEVSESHEDEERENPEEDIQAQLRRELASLRKQLAHVENLLDQQATEVKIRETLINSCISS